MIKNLLKSLVAVPLVFGVACAFDDYSIVRTQTFNRIESKEVLAVKRELYGFEDWGIKYTKRNLFILDVEFSGIYKKIREEKYIENKSLQSVVGFTNSGKEFVLEERVLGFGRDMPFFKYFPKVVGFNVPVILSGENVLINGEKNGCKVYSDITGKIRFNLTFFDLGDKELKVQIENTNAFLVLPVGRDINTRNN